MFMQAFQYLSMCRLKIEGGVFVILSDANELYPAFAILYKHIVGSRK